MRNARQDHGLSFHYRLKYFVGFALHGYSMDLLKRNDEISSLKSRKPVTSNYNERFLLETILRENVTLILA